MCKYCEKQKRENKYELVDLLVDMDDTMACISEISPIAKRKYPDCEREFQVYTRAILLLLLVYPLNIVQTVEENYDK